jgi:hypothetical protein
MESSRFVAEATHEDLEFNRLRILQPVDELNNIAVFDTRALARSEHRQAVVASWRHNDVTAPPECLRRSWVDGFVRV